MALHTQSVLTSTLFDVVSWRAYYIYIHNLFGHPHCSKTLSRGVQTISTYTICSNTSRGVQTTCTYTICLDIHTVRTRCLAECRPHPHTQSVWTSTLFEDVVSRSADYIHIHNLFGHPHCSTLLAECR